MKPLIAVIDWDFQGHRLLWYTFFCRACLDLGCEVAALCPNPEEARQSISSLGEEHVAKNRIRFGKIKTNFSPRFVPGRYRSKVQPYLFGAQVRDSLKELEREFGRSADWIFLSCIVAHEEPLARKVANTLRRPWTGMNLQARIAESGTARNGSGQFAMKELFQHPDFVAMTVIDESMNAIIENSLKKPAVLVPELTDERFEADHPLEKRFRRFANGSKLVLAIGHLRPNKGILNLARIALDPSVKNLSFAFVGEVPWGLFKAKDRELMEHALTHAPSAIFHLNRIPTEMEFNAVVRSCDVLFAAYHDFPHSSMTLTKAAVFRKPLIVSDGHLMAARTREYRMGEVVPQDDSPATVGAIRRITEDYPAWQSKNNPRWENYQDEHSYKALIKAVTKLLAAVENRNKPNGMSLSS